MKPSFGKRLAMMLGGLVVLAVGIALFRLPKYGNDPFTGMCFAISDTFGVSLGLVEVCVNSALFLLMLALARGRIHIGTVLNTFGLGYLVDFFVRLFTLSGWPQGVLLRTALCAAALLVTSLGCSLYFTAGLGVSPYDALSFILDKYTPLPFAGCRVLTDAACVLACAALHGVIGVGTVASAFGMGPVIAWCNRKISEPLLGKEPANADR